MSKNLYDLFSEYNGEIPKIEEKSCNKERIKQLVRNQTEEKKIKVRRNPKIFFISFAAALVAATSVTAVAYSNGFEPFKHILRKNTSNPSVSSELPLVNGGDESGMEENISVDSVAFSGSENAEVKTAGMYYDNNTLMLSVEMKFAQGTVIPENAVVLPYFTMKNGGTVTELANQSGVANAAVLTKGDEENTRIATFYLSENEISGSTIGVRLDNIVTRDDISSVQAAVIAEQQRWRDEFAESDDTDQWKAYWKENNFDQRTLDFMEDYLAGCQKVVEGSWYGEIEVPAEPAKAMSFEGDGFTVTVDTLSLTLGIDRKIPEMSNAAPVITLKDGTVLVDTGTNEEKWFIDNGVMTDGEHEDFANIFGNVYSYSKPHSVEDIAEIAVYVFEYDSSALSAEKYTVYTSEQ